MPPATGGYPTTPPAQICGNASILYGPATQPVGSVRIDPGQDLYAATLANPVGSTFWLTPGVHTLGTSQFAQVIPKNNNTYIGAPGAILDGQKLNNLAFGQAATGVSIRYLTIQNFGVPPVGTSGGNNNEGVVNHDSGTGWTVEYNTIRNNAGAGVFIGSDNVVRYNCLTANGQYGFSSYKPERGSLANVVLDHNEISFNNQDDWEARISGCGCTGAGKFWDSHNVTVTNNWVHHNKSVGIWADVNNYGFRIERNYINDNDSEGIFYEASYNAVIRNNTLKQNAIVKGRAFASRGDSFPVGAIYISESGGDSRINGGVYSTMEISSNLFDNNWSGVVLWENADRYCNSPAHPGDYCPLTPTGNRTNCVAGTINNEPYYSDCRWKTQNISVHRNRFVIDNTALGCAATNYYCGHQALFSNYGTYPEWSPYKGTAVQDAITFKQNNRFSNNVYVGDWRVTAFDSGRRLTLADWQGAPYGQDAGSVLNG
ncbi:MAG: right-handed parallel beta-helix repeat-containing protein, partial [Actinobacteria bacterium]|nr:right-handed parallel beta-helix repeat-containing protein [Actinomycetota bacterium]